MRDEYDIYIGRPGPFGNPYTHKDGEFAKKVGSVEEAVDKYREYILNKPQLLNRLSELKGKKLGCWCKTSKNPNALCHGDVLVELIESLNENTNQNT